MLEATRSLSRHILTASIDMRLDHHPSDVPIASSQLGTYVIEYFGLIVVILLRIAIFC